MVIYSLVASPSLSAIALIIPPAVVTGPWWPPPDSTAWAAWVQGIGTVLAVFVAVGSLLWQQHQLRADIRRRDQQYLAGVQEQMKTQAKAISGWVQYPEKVSFDHDHATWAIEGMVINRSDSAIWRVLASLVDDDGNRLPVPPLYVPHLPPGQDWKLRWAVGWRVEPWDGPSSDNSTASPGMTPFPEAMLKPGRTLSLQLTFRDADNCNWQRRGSHLSQADPAATEPPSGCEALTLVLDLTDQRHLATGAAARIRGGVRGLLLQAIADYSSQVLGIHDRVRQPDDLAGHLAYDRSAWSIRPDFAGSVHDATLTGALHRFNRNPRKDMLENDHEGGDIALLWDQACATMVALSGVIIEKPL